MVDKTNQSVLDKLKYPAIVISGTVILVIVLAVALGQPAWKSYTKSRDELKQKRAVQEKLEENLLALQDLKEKEEDLKKKNDQVIKALPTHKDVSRLFVEFERIATENGLNINGVQETTLGEQPAPGSVKPAVYNVKASTSGYPSTKEALKKIEGALRILSVSGINISGTGGSLTVDLEVTTYLRGE